jgi:hypothetical protein
MQAASAIARHVSARHGRDYLRMLALELDDVKAKQPSCRCVSISRELAGEISEGLRVEADALDRFSEEESRR